MAEEAPRDTLSHGEPRLGERGYGVVRADARTDALVGQCWRPDALSAGEHKPADVVPQPLVVEYELANRLRELVALPPALESLLPSFTG